MIRTDTERRAGVTISSQVLHLRARLLSIIRTFFERLSVLEVDTPVLSAAGTTDPNLHSFTTYYQVAGRHSRQPLYLHTSPEFPMKRLLVAGSGCIYQIAKVFRNSETGRYHNPEFVLLEWYRVGFDHHRLMDEVGELVRECLKETLELQETQRLSYREVFLQHLDIDPHRASVAELGNCCESQRLIPPPGMPVTEADPWLDLLLTHCIEPRLPRGRLIFIYDYPASQAALAKIRPGNPAVAERFELYLNGIELANGFNELNDPDEQRRRFEQDNQVRENQGLPVVAIDENLLQALAGLPDCAGVALGFDRLLMIAAGKLNLAEVIAFPFDQL
jgi:lysyl-tRNA synthetase class 2